jgi:hypothetical protein
MTKMLIPNPNYKGKEHTESTLSIVAPKVEPHHPPAKIHSPLRIMEFSDDNDDTEEEKDEPSVEIMVTLKQKITALEEQVTELHLVVYDQKDDFVVLHKATTSKLKHFARALGNPSLYNAPSA